jgi:GAF domain-containing protein
LPIRFPIDEKTATGRSILLRAAQLGGPRELALPLAAAGRALGALVVVMRDPVEREDLNVMRLVADQIGVSIENARLFEESASRLEEIEALNRRLTRDAWEGALENSEALRYTRDPEDRWPAPPERLGKQGGITAETYLDEDGRSVLAAPLVLRGESIGALAVTRPQGAAWTRDEHLLVEAVAARLSMIAEGIRLVEETSWRAEREERISQVSASLFARTSSVEDVVQAALDELSGVLGSDHVALRIGSPPTDGDGDGKETHSAPAPRRDERELSDG